MLEIFRVLNKKAKTIFASIIIAAGVMLMIFLLLNLAIAYTATNSAVSINYNLVTQKIAGRGYTPTCFGTCDLVFSISYSGSNVPSSVMINSTKLKTQFDWIKGQGNLKEIKIYYLHKSQEKVTDYSKICLPYNKTIYYPNATYSYPYFKNCTQVITGSHIENKGKWRELNSLALETGKTAYFDIRGSFKPSLGGFKVDIIPNVEIARNNFALHEMAWWVGAQYSYKRQITNTSIFSDVDDYSEIPMLVNVSIALGDKEFWTLANSSYIYYNGSSEYTSLNSLEDAEMPWQNINDVQSRNPANIYSDYMYISHNASYDESPQSTPVIIETAPSLGLIGDGMRIRCGRQFRTV